MKDADSILEELEKSPGDWNLRILAIEHKVQTGDIFAARQLVREDPSTDPVPADIQVKLHELLTKGASAAPATQAPEAEETPVPVESEQTPVPVEPEPPRQEELVEKPTQSFSELQEKPSGGLGALIESDPIESAPQEKSRKPGKPLPVAPEIRFEKAIQRWQEYDGNLLLVEN
ncbi:MAG: hypothetical protein ABF384_08950, partial [Verrucomicrobiales bacterium]